MAPRVVAIDALLRHSYPLYAIHGIYRILDVERGARYGTVRKGT